MNGRVQPHLLRLAQRQARLAPFPVVISGILWPVYYARIPGLEEMAEDIVKILGQFNLE